MRKATSNSRIFAGRAPVIGLVAAAVVLACRWDYCDFDFKCRAVGHDVDAAPARKPRSLSAERQRAKGLIAGGIGPQSHASWKNVRFHDIRLTERP